MDLRQQAIERILGLSEEDLSKVITYLEKRRESASDLRERSLED